MTDFFYYYYYFNHKGYSKYFDILDCVASVRMYFCGTCPGWSSYTPQGVFFKIKWSFPSLSVSLSLISCSL